MMPGSGENRGQGFHKLRKILKVSRKLLFWGFLALVLGLFVRTLFEHGERQKEVKQNFAPVIAALDQHRQEVGSTPEELNDLVPQYLSAVPKCPLDRWPNAYYGKRENGSYTLDCIYGIVIIFPQGMMYDSETKDWMYWD